MQVQAVSKITLTEQIMEQIMEQIQTGQIRPGERLPSERTLAEMFHVTRNSVREAIRALSVLGLIEIKPGSGNVVTDRRYDIPQGTITWMYRAELNKFDDVYAARELIETEVYLTCFRRKTPQILSEIQQHYQDIVDYAASAEVFSIDHYCDLLDTLDLYVGASCGNGVYDKFMQTMVTLRRASALKISQLAEARVRAVEDRGKVVEAMAGDDEARLARALKHFFKRSLFTTAKA